MATAITDEIESPGFTIRPDSLAASMVILLSMTVIQRAVGFGRSILLCRWLSPEELGYWDLTFAFFDFIAPIAVFSLPACFARYVEHYRHKGQLRTFLRRMLLVIAGLVLCAMGLMFWNRSLLSALVYNQSEAIGLVSLVILGLPGIVLFNTITEIFCGLQKFRALSILHFMQSMLFAALALSMAGLWQSRASSVTMAYGLASALCCIVPTYWLLRLWSTLPSENSTVCHHDFWKKLLLFAGAVWFSNFLAHLLILTDRYMILHHSGMDLDQATAAVGQYHSARIIPLLIVQLSGIIGTMFVPYFSHDWEAGRRDLVRARINTFLKLIGIALLSIAVIILIASPLLFVGVFQNKFQQGAELLPLTLLCATWFSMFSIARSYLWCAERVSLVNIGLVVGLAVNIGANLVFLPWLGIKGAAISASLANMTLLITVYQLAIRRGLRISIGTWLVSIAPAVLWFGPWFGLGTVLGLVLLSLTTTLVFDSTEKSQLALFARDAIARLRAIPGPWGMPADRLGTAIIPEEP